MTRLFGINVQGGTRAGIRTVKQQASDYTCPVSEGGCGKIVRYFWVKCPNCGHPRPE
jgi:hypothetical protein